jgi:U3 small nucleolar RNA-associated protein 22
VCGFWKNHSGPAQTRPILHPSWDWQNEPLLIPLQLSIGMPSNTLTHFPVESLKVALQSFRSTRKKDPGFHQNTYFVATEDDLEGSMWLLSTSAAPQEGKSAKNILHPTRLISDRLQTLASASLEVLEASLEVGSISFQPKTLFKSPLKHFDFHVLLLSISPSIKSAQTQSCPYLRLSLGLKLMMTLYLNSSRNCRSAIPLPLTLFSFLPASN